jgi:hypothetical protein
MTALALLTCAVPGLAQPIPFDSDRWAFDAEESAVVDHLGRRALRLQGGLAWIEDAAGFQDGVIEFDIAVTGERGFMGGIWRMQDRNNYEEFYIRPHQSGNPDANQYTPVFNGVSGWQLYHGPGYGVPVDYALNRWMHIKIVVSGTRAEVYIDSDEPVLVIPELKHPVAAGRVGLSAGAFAPAYYANFTYQARANPPLAGTPEAPPAAPPGTVTEWEVSAPFGEALLAGKTMLSESDRQDLNWQPLPAERTGITNLARITSGSTEENTVFARLTLEADQAETRQIRFGYSDRVKVYLNGRLVYAGDNGYQSRDYRYLGTIGLFDALSLPLRPGTNEVLFAVSESFGGWGILARVE